MKLYLESNNCLQTVDLYIEISKQSDKLLMFKYFNEKNYLEAYCVKNYDYNHSSSISQIYVINFQKMPLFASSEDLLSSHNSLTGPITFGL